VDHWRAPAEENLATNASRDPPKVVSPTVAGNVVVLRLTPVT
jgi:hypothetical protein